MRNVIILAGMLTATVALAQVQVSPSQGVELRLRRGFFTETDVGTFFTVGGSDSYSTAQAYLQLGIGYDLTERIELGAHFGLGANAFNCFAGRENGICNASDSFTVSFFDATAAYLVRLADRFYLTPKVAVGYTLLDPAPRLNAHGGITQGINGGVGVGVEYATAMDHFSVGADVLFRYIFAANIPAFTIYPRLKYTF